MGTDSVDDMDQDGPAQRRLRKGYLAAILRECQDFLSSFPSNRSAETLPELARRLGAALESEPGGRGQVDNTPG